MSFSRDTISDGWTFIGSKGSKGVPGRLPMGSATIATIVKEKSKERTEAVQKRQAKTAV